MNEFISGEAKKCAIRNNIFRDDTKPINRHGLVCMLLQNARSKSHLHFCIIYRIYESLNRLNLALFLLHFIRVLVNVVALSLNLKMTFHWKYSIKKWKS